MFESDDLSTYNEERKYKGGRFVEKVRYMISDAAAMAGVESHVLRYWEEELDLTIPRNEMGHRYYTRENIQEFQKIKQLKEQGYQLKAIRFILHNGSMDKPDMRDANLASLKTESEMSSLNHVQPSTIPANTSSKMNSSVTPAVAENASVSSVRHDRQISQATSSQIPQVDQLSAEERMAQFRELMSDIVGRAIAQNNEELSLNIGQEVRETVLKEMNYLFREQEEAQEERYKKLDAAIRGNLRKKRPLFAKKDKPEKSAKDKTGVVPTNRVGGGD